MAALSKALSSDPVLRLKRPGGRFGVYWSGRWESNPRHTAWEAVVLPLNYARAAALFFTMSVPSKIAERSPYGQGGFQGRLDEWARLRRAHAGRLPELRQSRYLGDDLVDIFLANQLVGMGENLRAELLDLAHVKSEAA